MDAPHDDLIRASLLDVDGPARFELRTDSDGRRHLTGHFARFNAWNEIDSWLEGRFLERILPGAFKRTIKQNRDHIKVLYDHGHDMELGNKPLGPIEILREDDIGPYFDVALIDTSYNRDFVIPAAEAGLLGVSYRFRVIRESWNDEPAKSAHNPERLPERTIEESRLYEFGPVTFPADAKADLALRSLTDQAVLRRLQQDPVALQKLLDRLDVPALRMTSSDEDPAQTTPLVPASERRKRALELRGVLTNAEPRGAA